MRVGRPKSPRGIEGGARTTNLRVGGRHRAGGHGLAPSVLAGAELRLLAALGRRGRAHRAAPHGGPGWPVGWITRGSGVSLNKRGTNASRVRGARARASVAKGRVPRPRVRGTRQHTLARGKRGECPGRPAGTARLAVSRRTLRRCVLGRTCVMRDRTTPRPSPRERFARWTSRRCTRTPRGTSSPSPSRLPPDTTCR